VSSPVKPDGRSARWDDHRIQRRAEFVAAALVVIDRDGPEPSVGAIAREAGVGRPVLYRHFTDRADLEQAVVDQAVNDLLAAVAPTLRVEGGLVESITRAIGSYLDWLQDNANLHAFLRQHAAGAGRARATVVARVADLARDYLSRSGVAPAEIAPVVAAGIIGLSDAAVNRWVEEPGSLDRDTLTQVIVAMIQGASVAAIPPRRPA
jgi:AcrR family transcriptional regulator